MPTAVPDRTHRPHRVRRLLLGLLVVVVLLVALTGLWLVALRLTDPLDAIRRDTTVTGVLRDSAYAATTATGEARIFRDLTLETRGAGTIRLTTSRPAEMGDTPLPLIVILAGLRTGRESLGVVDEHGPNLLVGYQYPYDQETWYRRAPLLQVLEIRRAVLNVPAQVTLVARRLAADTLVDNRRSSLLGYSFGALFVPATQRLAAEGDHHFQASVLAFAGADIQGLMEANLRVDPRPLRGALAWIVASLLHPMEPQHHLPHLDGNFLVIRGAADDQIPPHLSARLARLTPQPREVITLDAGHMNPRNTGLTQEVVRLSQDWLVRHGVVEPPAER